MAVISISPSNRAVTAPEATRVNSERTRLMDAPKNAETVPVEKTVSKKDAEENQRISRENKDNGTDNFQLYQAPGPKKPEVNKPLGTMVNVTA